MKGIFGIRRKQEPHWRTSIRGKPFPAGRGAPNTRSPTITDLEQNKLQLEEERLEHERDRMQEEADIRHHEREMADRQIKQEDLSQKRQKMRNIGGVVAKPIVVGGKSVVSSQKKRIRE